MRKLGKKYVEASKKIEKNKAYQLEEAVKLAKETSITKFDSSVELAVKLNIDTKKADQQMRGSLVLPNGNGKTKKILVLAKGAAAEAAKKAGADYVGEAVEYRADQYGNIHVMVGKVSFDEKKLVENVQFVLNTLVKAKPATVKGKYITNISLSTTMGPGIHVDQDSIDM